MGGSWDGHGMFFIGGFPWGYPPASSRVADSPLVQPANLGYSHDELETSKYDLDMGEEWEMTYDSMGYE